VDACEQYHGFLGLHEFSSPWLWWQTGTFQPTNCSGRADIPGEGDTGWATLRYRKVYREVLELNGLGQVPLLITECGLGPVAGVCAHMSRGPWLTHIEFWHRHSGAFDPIAYWRDNPERDPERYYAEQWIWYDTELQKDDFVRGAAMFTVGGQRPWEHYDFGGRRVTQHLLRHIRTQRPLTAPNRAFTVPLDGATTLPAAFSNLLINTGLEEGHAYFADDTHERAVPAGWRLTYADADTPTEPGQTAPWRQPFTALINRHALITAEQPRLFSDGGYRWKISSADAPVWAQLTQGVSGLRWGGRYTFAVRLLPDLWTVDGEQRLYPAEVLASEVRLSAKFTGQTFDSGWLTLDHTPPGEYTRLTLDLAAPADYVELRVEVRGRWAWPMCAWYVAELSLLSV
jgi:hypothetical protein